MIPPLEDSGSRSVTCILTERTRTHMKSLGYSFIVILCSLNSLAQCSSVTLSVSASDTSFVQLYHPGFFLIPSGEDNVCTWEVSTFDGAIIHQDLTSGEEFFEQGSTLFEHSVPITDSMRVVMVITNETDGITCSVTDTLVWLETEVLPDEFIGNWFIINESGGIEEELSSTLEGLAAANGIRILPSYVEDAFRIQGEQASYRLSLLDMKGQQLMDLGNLPDGASVDVSTLAAGMYLVRFRDPNGADIGIQRILKR